MSKALFTGASTSICRELKPTFPPQIEVIPLSSKDYDLSDLDNIPVDLIRSCDYFVLAHGVLSSCQYKQMKEEEIVKSLKINLLSTIKIIEIALENPKARIVAIGSESGLKGSWDVCYGLAKSALHKYIEEKRIIHPDQQLVCVAPSLIEDSGMTNRRVDKNNVDKAIKNNPKGRGLKAKEVANVVYNLLFRDEYINNTVIHMNGGKYARS